MDEPYIGEIRPIGFSYAPKGWAICNGQSLPITQNQALFSLLGTQFGGDGRTTFNLPDLRSRIPVGTGTLPGGATYPQGQAAGSEQVALTQAQLPAHAHPYTGTLQTSNSAEALLPTGQLPASDSGLNQYVAGPSNTTMAVTVAGTTSTVGAGQGHENRQPFMALNYVIALVGVYPTRQ